MSVCREARADGDDDEPSGCHRCGEPGRERYIASEGLRQTCDDCYWLGHGLPIPPGERDHLRCRDCWRDDNQVGRNVEKRETWDLYPEDRGRRWSKPAICDECWARRQRHAPVKPPFGPPPDGHEPTHKGERCLSCGEPGIIPVDALGTPRRGVVVYACPSCGADKMDDWAMEDWRWDVDAGEAVRR